MSDKTEQGVDWTYTSDPNDYPDDGATPEPSQSNLEGWMVYAGASGKDREDMEPAGVRLPTRTLRQLEEMVLELKGLGYPVRTKSDLIRVCVVKTLSDFAVWLGDDHNSAHAWRVSLRHMAKQAENAESMLSARTSVGKLVSSLGYYVSDAISEHEEARDQIDAFLKPVMGDLTSDHPFLARIFLRELFRNAAFKSVLYQVRQKAGSTVIIDNAEKAYHNIMGNLA